MKKTLAILFLCFALFFATAAMAAEEVTAPEAETAFADLSDWVLQAGGFPRAAAEVILFEGGDTSEEAVKAVLLAGLLARSEEIDISAYSLTIDTALTYYTQVLNAHPELFYVGSGMGYSYYGTTIFAIRPVYLYTEEETAQLNARAEEVLSGLEEGWTDLQKLLYLHDWLVTHCEYDLTYTRYSAYDALVDGSAVCQGYSLAYQLLLQKAGMEASVVSSDGMNHAWNLVTLGGKQYYADCTWDDPLYYYEAYCSHENFLRSRSGIAETGHDSTDWVVGGAAIYDAIPGSADYDGYFWSDVCTPMPMIGSICAYIHDDDCDNIYLRDLSTGAETSIPLSPAPIWLDWEDKNSYWPYNFGSVAAVGDSFYFSTATDIRSLSLSGETASVYTLSAEQMAQGYIYGMIAEGSTLCYTLATDYASGGIRESYVLQPPLPVFEFYEEWDDEETGETVVIAITEMDFTPGNGWGARLRCGEDFLTEADLPYLQLSTDPEAQWVRDEEAGTRTLDAGALKLVFHEDDESFSLFVMDWIDGSAAMRYTRVPTANDFTVRSSLPEVGLYTGAAPSRETYTMVIAPSTESRSYYIIAAEGLTIQSLQLSQTEIPGLSAEQLSAGTWRVTVTDGYDVTEAFTARATAQLSDGEDTWPSTFYLWLNAYSYSLRYDAGEGSGAPEAQIKRHGTALTLSDTAPTRPGYVFLGWADSSTAAEAQYQPGDSFTPDADTTLYALWKVRETGFTGSERVTSDAGDAFRVSISCALGDSLTAYGARYGSDGKFLGLTSIALTPGQENELVIPIGDGSVIKVFLVNGSYAPASSPMSIPVS